MKTYTGDYSQEIAFPLSGIGTGGVSLSGIGELIDWELTGRANKGVGNEYSHFAIRAERDGKIIDARVLQGDRLTGLSGSALASHHLSWGYGQGLNRATMAGIAHFSDVTFNAAFPFAELEYRSENMPAAIRLQAYNPFIPGNEDDSSLPAAFFLWEITNTAELPTDFTLAFSVGNPFRITDGGVTAFEQKDGVSSLTMTSRNYTPDQIEYGELAVSTDCEDVSYQENWFRGGWFDDVTTFWREFTAPGRMKNRCYNDEYQRGKLDIGDMGTLSAHISLKPGETKTVRFIMTWYYPHFVKYWGEEHPVWKHEYVRRFSSAADVRAYCCRNADSLYEKSARFRDALERMTLPDPVREAAAFNLCVLKNPTCLRLENGEFWAFEGTGDTFGCCEGTCDHVWGYQYALPALFPRVARQILEIDYTYNMRESGEILFRTMLPLGSSQWDFRACVDGQMGCILRFYREWKLSGDNEWLKRWWKKVKKSLEYAWSPENRDRWDPEKTGVISGRQHHTLDVELFGPNSWLEGFYLAALKAGAEMADAMGEPESAAEYRELFRRGQAYTEKELFNGRHYIQKVDVKDRSTLDPYAEADPGVYYSYWNDEKGELKYQIASGCEIDQMLAQWHGTLMGLGDIFDPDHRKIAARTLYEQNFLSMRDVFNPCRIFAVNGESGTVICTWAEDAYHPQIPIPYTEECMTGFEYAAAGLMIQEGLIDEGVALVTAIRDRYDGKKRNPFAEIEAGASYARSMASFALPAVFSGYVCDLAKGEIGFKPVLPGAHHTFWSAEGVWGEAEIGENAVTLSVSDGGVTLRSFLLPDERFAAEVASVTADGREIPFTAEGRRVIFAVPAGIRDSLVLKK